MILKPLKTPSYLLISFIWAVFQFSYNTALADKIKIKKVKGMNAIVESSIPLIEGETYELATEDPISQDIDYKNDVRKPRNNSVTFGSKLEFSRSDNLDVTQLNLQGRYGWNYSSLELGVVLDFSSYDQGSGATTTTLIGGYYDYNLVTNHYPKKMVYGIFTLAAFGSTNYPSAQSGGSSTNIELDIGGFITYFLANSGVALRGELYAKYKQINTSANQNSLIGAGARGLLIYYF